MARPKKQIEEGDVVDEATPATVEPTQKEKMVHLLKSRIPSLFDIHPNGSISTAALNRLVDELLEL